MSLTLGRTTLDDMDGPSIKVTGDALEFTADLNADTVDEMKAKRQQLAGYVGNPDEEAIPLVNSEDSTFDGFYRVQSIVVPSSEMQLTTGYVPPVTVSLRRVGGYANPWFEVVTQSVVRTNGHSITTPSTIIATGPAVATLSNELVDLYPDLSAATTSPDRLLSNGHTIRCYRTAAPRTVTSVRYSALASSFYLGAATLEVQYGTSTWYPVVGQQLYDHGAATAGGSPVSAWRLSNGLIRLTSTTSSSTGGTGTFEIWDNAAGAWESQTIQWIGAGGPGNIGPRAVVKAPVVVRNSPEQVTIRIQTARLAETWTIQRGAYFATANVYDPQTSRTNWQIGMASSTAGTSITGGVRVTSNDANGNRMVFATDVARTADTVNTRVGPTSITTSATYMVGCELAGSSAATGNAAADLVDQFIGAVAWRQRIVRQ